MSSLQAAQQRAIQAKPRTKPALQPRLAKALLEAQKEMPAVKPDSKNPHFGNSFVSLGHLLAKTRPVLNKHGISVSQLHSRAEDGSPTLTTILTHESGEERRETAPLLLSKQDPQGLGSAITYMRRYSLAAALGISDQEDDDGNAASPQVSAPAPGKTASEGSDVPSGKQLDFIVSLARDLGADANDQELLRAYASKNLTGGKEGTGSRAIAALKGESERDPADVLVQFVAKASEWAARESDLPVDTEGLPEAEAA